MRVLILLGLTFVSAYADISQKDRDMIVHVATELSRLATDDMNANIKTFSIETQLALAAAGKDDNSCAKKARSDAEEAIIHWIYKKFGPLQTHLQEVVSTAKYSSDAAAIQRYINDVNAGKLVLQMDGMILSLRQDVHDVFLTNLYDQFKRC